MKIANETNNGYRIYVWIITTSTLMLLGLLLWPLTVREFQTTSVFSFRYQPTSGIEKTTLNSWVVESLRSQTDRNAIADIYSQMESSVSSSVLNSMDPELIRQAINIQGRPGSTANSVEYRLSLIGEGTEDEIEFINTIVSRINNHLDKQLSRKNDTQAVKQLSNDLERFHDGRLRQVSSQISGVMDSLTTVENDIRIVASDLQDFSSMPVSHRPGVLGRPVTESLEALYAEKKRLLDHPGMTEYHPEVARVQQKIEGLINGSPAGNQSTATNNSSLAASSDVRVVKNPFASSPKIDLEAEPEDNNFFAPMGDILDSIELIDLSPTRQALQDVQQAIDNLEGTEEVVSRLNDRALKDLHADSPVSLSGFDMARRSKPIGGNPTLTQFLFLMVLAGMFGAVVTLNYDPVLRRTPFRSVEQLQRKLSLPVIGVLRNRVSEAPHPFHKRAATRVVRLCEWTLLALAVLLILAALANSDVAAAFIENPFHGITQTIWLMSPNH